MISSIKNQIINSCICIEGNCALHIQNEFEYKSINFGKDKKSLRISREDNNIKKDYFVNNDI